MTTFALIGAGPGLGAAVARRFGRHGFDIALVSRSQAHLDTLAARLGDDGVTARGFAADVRDPDALNAALDAATSTLGPIEVVQYSPVPHKDFMKPVLQTTTEDLQGPLANRRPGAVRCTDRPACCSWVSKADLAVDSGQALLDLGDTGRAHQQISGRLEPARNDWVPLGSERDFPKRVIGLST
ncbi:SDR family NAD(P)-dependent oxidoreductase [Streptomyces sp. NPDC048508]|uniref:SDR family NAD(P)-dependent oxidoreductase n=1 Tax=Streptomyces sp. NPDC048508 TaxID=3365561 RepID=UPI00371DAC48